MKFEESENIRIFTTIENKKIRQEIQLVMDGTITRLSEAVWDTAETQFRESLIKLGWTPPSTK